MVQKAKKFRTNQLIVSVYIETLNDDRWPEKLETNFASSNVEQNQSNCIQTKK